VVRESIPKGDINLYKIDKVLPFSNSLVLIEVKGQKIYDAIERGLRVYPSNLNVGFLQVSGINYTIDGSKTAGNRLVSVEINGKPLDKDKYYKVATNDYLYNGGDGYEEFEDAKLISMLEPLKDVLVKYLREKGTVSSKEEGRIKVVKERYK
jgi:2',3'-cyclic-nucleotide 2'-phosphodiesterase (5'-nucleotidase family)